MELDAIDRRLVAELERDADRPNVALAREIGLSPAATLNRVKRLKQAGVIRGIVAEVDAEALGFPLHVFVAVEVRRHDERASERFREAVDAMPQVIRADWVT